MTFQNSLTLEQLTSDTIDAHLGGDSAGLLDRADVFVRTGAAYADLSLQAGVDNTGGTECSTAIQTALDQAAALGVTVWGRGRFKIAATITIRGSVDLDQATFVWVGAPSSVTSPGDPGYGLDGVAVRIGDPAGTLNSCFIRAPRVVAAAKTGNGWAQVAGMKGVALGNLYSCDVTIPYINNFTDGLLVAPDPINGGAQGLQHTHIRILHLDNNQRNLVIAPVNGTSTANSGWANQNWIEGGRMSHNSNEGVQVPGTRQLLTTTAKNINNGWTFLGTSFETPDVAEYHIEHQMQYAVFLNCRFENTGGDAHRRIWNRGSAKNNLMLWGFNAGQLTQIKDAGAEKIRVFSESGIDLMTALTMENQTSSNLPTLTVLPAGTSAAGGNPTTAWAMRSTGIALEGKRGTDTAARVRLDYSAGQVGFGDGTAAPALTIGALSGMLDLEGQQTQTAAPAAGTAGPLPTAPAGYLVAVVNGGVRRIPYY